MLTVTDEAASSDLTTIAAVRSELGFTDNGQDELIQTAVHRASEFIATWCNRTFRETTFQETFRLRNATQELILSEYPVTEIETVEEDGEELDEDDYELDAAKGIVLRLTDDEPDCWAAPARTTITYTAGHSAITDLPNDIQRAAVILAKQYVLSADRDPMIRSESSDGLGQSVFFSGGISPEVEELLERHRKSPIG